MACEGKHGTRCLVASLVIFLFFGIILLFGSWLVSWGITEDLDKTILSTIIIDSKDASGYKGWSTNTNSDSAPLYQHFYLYNLTNLEEVQKGQLPLYEQCGPYSYYKYKTYFNVEFHDNGNQVSYNTWARYEFIPERSHGNQNDTIINLNPAYLAAMAASGGELEILAAMTGPSIADMFTFFTTTFTSDVISSFLPITFSRLEKQIISNLTHLNQSDPTSYFANAFFNLTSTKNITGNASIWDDMMISYSGPASNISEISANNLLNRSIQYSLLDSNWNSTKIWRQAADGQVTAQQILITKFNLTQIQLEILLKWRNNTFTPNKVTSYVLELWGIEELSDLAYLQWGQGLVTAGVSVYDLYPENNFPGTPEIGIFWAQNEDPFNILPLEPAKKFLNGTFGIFKMANVGVFLKAVESLNFTLLESQWGIDQEQLGILTPYLGYITPLFAEAKMQAIFAAGGGLFKHRTAYEWLMNSVDPLIEIAAGSAKAAQASLVYNVTTEAEAAETPPCLCYTGKNEIYNISNYIEWNGQKQLVGGYSNVYNITGASDWGQFQPWVNMETILYSFDSNFMRILELVPIGMVEYDEIKMIRYEISNASLAPTPVFDQIFEGFANLTGFHNGSTMFLSIPHMNGADPYFVSKIKGMKEWQNSSMDVTTIDIEPNSGLVTHYHECLQVNAYLDPSKDWFNLYNMDVPKDVMYPVMWVAEDGQLTDDNANAVKKSLYAAITLSVALFWVMVGVGIIFILVSLIFAAVLWGRKLSNSPAASGYSNIQS